MLGSYALFGYWEMARKGKNSKESQFSAYERERRIKYNKNYLIFFTRKRINLEGIERKKKLLSSNYFLCFFLFIFPNHFWFLVLFFKLFYSNDGLTISV